MRSKQQVKDSANAEVAISDYLPFGNHVSNNVIKLKNGEYIATWKLEGISFETVEADNIYFSFNSARNTDSQTATITVSNTDGTSEMFTVDF